MDIVKPGRFFFAVSVAALGLQHFMLDNYLVDKPASDTLMAQLLALAGFLFRISLLFLSLAILMGKKPRLSSMSLGLLILVWVMLRHVPLLIRNPNDPAEWNFISMAIAIAGGAFILSASFPVGSSKPSYRARVRFLKTHPQKIILLGSFLYGISLLVFGFQHIRYADFIASMIPSWIPGNQFWAWATGFALIGSGMAILLQIKIKLTSLLLGIMILLWVIILHLPRLVLNPFDPYEWTSGFQALAISASAFILNGIDKQEFSSVDVTYDIKNREVDRLIEKLKKERPNRTSALETPIRTDPSRKSVHLR